MDTNEQFFDCVCRTCMQELIEASSYDANIKQELQWQFISDTIEECGSLRIIELLSITIPKIDVHLTDRLPKKICHKCLERLQNIYQFQQMCVHSDQQMRDLVANGTITEASVADEISTKMYSGQEPCLEAREHRIEFESEASQSSAADPLQSISEAAELCSDSQSDVNDEQNGECYGSEIFHTTAILEKGVLTVDTPEQQLRSPSPIHICPQCNKTFKQIRLLRRHLKRHKEWDDQKEKTKEKFEYFRFKCDICNRHFHKEESLQNHRLAHDANADNKLHSYTCELCDKIYSRRDILMSHKKKRHPAEKPQKPEKQYSCDICDKTFKRSYTLKEHISTHSNERPFLCPECGKSFSKESHLRSHCLRHSDVKAFECPHCPKKFRCRNDVSKHKVIHQEIKKHVCDICGDRFVKAHQLTTHKRYHSGVKPHKCDYCDMRFVTNYNKRLHMRTHTGEKPYKCKYCERSFAQSNDHVKHLRTHIGDNVYRCELCPSGFRLASQLRVHFATHKNEDEETRERNMKALKEEKAKLEFKLVEKKATVYSTLEKV